MLSSITSALHSCFQMSKDTKVMLRATHPYTCGTGNKVMTLEYFALGVLLFDSKVDDDAAVIGTTLSEAN